MLIGGVVVSYDSERLRNNLIRNKAASFLHMGAERRASVHNALDR